jgi:hypothetical protein
VANPLLTRGFAAFQHIGSVDRFASGNTGARTATDATAACQARQL